MPPNCRKVVCFKEKKKSWFFFTKVLKKSLVCSLAQYEPEQSWNKPLKGPFLGQKNTTFWEREQANLFPFSSRTCSNKQECPGGTWKENTDRLRKAGYGWGGEITSKKHPTKYPIKSSLSYCVVCKDKLAKTEAPFSRFWKAKRKLRCCTVRWFFLVLEMDRNWA